jgi:hypothetical protein
MINECIEPISKVPSLFPKPFSKLVYSMSTNNPKSPVDSKLLRQSGQMERFVRAVAVSEIGLIRVIGWD